MENFSYIPTPGYEGVEDYDPAYLTARAAWLKTQTPVTATVPDAANYFTTAGIARVADKNPLDAVALTIDNTLKTLIGYLKPPVSPMPNIATVAPSSGKVAVSNSFTGTDELGQTWINGVNYGVYDPATGKYFDLKTGIPLEINSMAGIYAAASPGLPLNFADTIQKQIDLFKQVAMDAVAANRPDGTTNLSPSGDITVKMIPDYQEPSIRITNERNPGFLSPATSEYTITSSDAVSGASVNQQLIIGLAAVALLVLVMR